MAIKQTHGHRRRRLQLPHRHHRFTTKTHRLAASVAAFLLARHDKQEKLKGGEIDDGEKYVLPSFQEFRDKTSDEDEEEKMDMLWEDLNDEFSKSCGKRAQNSDVSSPGREVHISCVKTLKLSKANGHMISGKKPSILVFISVLKKVFRMHNSHRTINKRSW